ncbi:hypothetical protein ARALYDRAFT_909189 [Arabidopsis lyrata subsp. lyrata]|uniref:Uncharacterized protein n=1 Tax=Arabidopsis lyrata subsp. lyrata TaxID=81972 RepID=D7M4G5_ARALL|nr:hypothetical protein ARALYDRAFT_909189 [Arabidopsis lyrata subsp. lyrata]
MSEGGDRGKKEVKDQAHQVSKKKNNNQFCRSLALVLIGDFVLLNVRMLVWFVVRAGFSGFRESADDNILQLISQAKGVDQKMVNDICLRLVLLQQVSLLVSSRMKF